MSFESVAALIEHFQEHGHLPLSMILDMLAWKCAIDGVTSDYILHLSDSSFGNVALCTEHARDAERYIQESARVADAGRRGEATGG